MWGCRRRQEICGEWAGSVAVFIGGQVGWMTAFTIVQRVSHSERITVLYGRLAWLYDPFTDHEPAHHTRALELAHIRPDEAVLEVACGTGRATVEIARRLGGGACFYAVDLTPAMLERARRKLDAAGILDRVQLGCADARNLPYADGTFDLLYNAYMFDLVDVSAMPDILMEFERVLRPGGRIVLVDMSKDHPGKTFYEWLYERGLLSFVSGGCRPVYLQPLLKEAGFVDVTREYRKNRSWFPLNRLHGTEIVCGYKPREVGSVYVPGGDPRAARGSLPRMGSRSVMMTTAGDCSPSSATVVRNHGCWPALRSPRFAAGSTPSLRSVVRFPGLEAPWAAVALSRRPRSSAQAHEAKGRGALAEKLQNVTFHGVAQ